MMFEVAGGILIAAAVLGLIYGAVCVGKHAGLGSLAILATVLGVVVGLIATVIYGGETARLIAGGLLFIFAISWWAG